MFNYLEWQGDNRYEVIERISYSITEKMSIKNHQKINRTRSSRQSPPTAGKANLIPVTIL